MAFAILNANASGSNFLVSLVSTVTSLMRPTLTLHFGFVTAPSRPPDLRLTLDLDQILDVLHCVKVSWFRHITVPTVRFALQPLIVSDDNGLVGVRLRAKYR